MGARSAEAEPCDDHIRIGAKTRRGRAEEGGETTARQSRKKWWKKIEGDAWLHRERNDGEGGNVYGKGGKGLEMFDQHLLAGLAEEFGTDGGGEAAS